MQKVRLYSSVWIYTIAIALSVLCAAFIFKMSNEVAPVSADRSGGIANVIAPMFVDGFKKLDTAGQIATVSSIDHIIRKIAHFCIYATLGALFTFASLWHERTWRRHLLLPLLFGALYAASDEIHQMFVPGRGPLFTDVILDSFGVIIGAAVVLLFVFLWRKHHS